MIRIYPTQSTVFTSWPDRYKMFSYIFLKDRLFIFMRLQLCTRNDTEVKFPSCIRNDIDVRLVRFA